MRATTKTKKASRPEFIFNVVAVLIIFIVFHHCTDSVFSPLDLPPLICAPSSNRAGIAIQIWRLVCNLLHTYI